MKSISTSALRASAGHADTRPCRQAIRRKIRTIDVVHRAVVALEMGEEGARRHDVRRARDPRRSAPARGCPSRGGSGPRCPAGSGAPSSFGSVGICPVRNTHPSDLDRVRERRDRRGCAGNHHETGCAHRTPPELARHAGWIRPPAIGEARSRRYARGGGYSRSRAARRSKGSRRDSNFS